MAHLVPDAITQDAGIVHHSVDAAEMRHRILNDARCLFGIGDVGAIDDRLAARGFDVVTGLLPWRQIGPLPFCPPATTIYPPPTPLPTAHHAVPPSHAPPPPPPRQHPS